MFVLETGVSFMEVFHFSTLFWRRRDLVWLEVLLVFKYLLEPGMFFLLGVRGGV